MKKQGRNELEPKDTKWGLRAKPHALAEIDNTFKKIKEGFEEFDALWNCVHPPGNVLTTRYTALIPRPRRSAMRRI